LSGQRVPESRTSDRKRPTAVCVELTARYDELVSDEAEKQIIIIIIIIRIIRIKFF